MALLRSVRYEGFRPNCSEVALGDAVEEGIDYAGRLGEPLPDSGTFARAGTGWLQATCSGEKLNLALEFHDAPPERHWRPWTEEMETPYRSRSGVVVLDQLEFWAASESLVLDGPGLYRVRVCAGQADDKDAWSLQFWPVAGPVNPPRWTARGGPAVPQERSGWRTALPEPVWELFCAAREIADDGETVTPEQILGLRDTVCPADIDEAAELADRLGLLVALGLLIEDVGGYRVVAELPRARDVLGSWPETITMLRGADRYSRFLDLAADLYSVLAWSAAAALTVDEVAGRLLVSAEDVRAAIDGAGSIDVFTELQITADGTITVSSSGSTDEEYRFGAPPAAGVIRNDGRMVVWKDGRPVVLSRFSHRDADEDEIIDLDYVSPKTMRATPHGILLRNGPHACRLLHPDGTSRFVRGEVSSVGLSEDGHRLAVTRRGGSGWTLQLIDLADGGDESIVWDGPVLRLKVIGAFDGWFYLNAIGSEILPSATWRWRPGRPAERLPRVLSQIDPLSGTTLTVGSFRLAVVTAAGARYHATIDPTARLAPGGTALYTTQKESPVLRFFDLDHPERQPRVHRLPADSEVSAMVWEDQEHLLIPTRSTDLADQPVRAYRLNTTNGFIELVSGLGTGPQRAYFVQHHSYGTF
jgi:hypothetical protein